MARRSLVCVGATDGDAIAGTLADSTPGSRAHLHMPRRRRTLSPLRASAGRAKTKGKGERPRLHALEIRGAQCYIHIMTLRSTPLPLDPVLLTELGLKLRSPRGFIRLSA
jgi:hypothetical protein